MEKKVLEVTSLEAQLICAALVAYEESLCKVSAEALSVRPFDYERARAFIAKSSVVATLHSYVLNKSGITKVKSK